MPLDHVTARKGLVDPGPKSRRGHDFHRLGRDPRSRALAVAITDDDRGATVG